MTWTGRAAIVIFFLVYACLVLHDKDECELGEDDCDVNAVCSNIFLSYICKCKERFTGDGKKCTEEDKCILNKKYCHANAHCLSKAGRYECQCHDGFIGDGKICVDDDECKHLPKKCHSDAKCENTVGSYTCKCKTGFAGDGIECNDTDECNLGSHDCHGASTCVNNQGSFSCECKDGFIGSGKWCAKNSSKWSEGETGWIQVITDKKTRPEAIENCSQEGARLIRLDGRLKTLSELWEITELITSYHVDAKMSNGKMVHGDDTEANIYGVGFLHDDYKTLSSDDGCLSLSHEETSFRFSSPSLPECTKQKHAFICQIQKKQ